MEKEDDAMMEDEAMEEEAMEKEDGEAMEEDDAMEKEDGEEEAVTEAEIIIEDFAHSPGTLTVEAGATVTVTNNDSASHTVTADDDSSFDTGLIAQGETVTFTAPTEPGEYSYHCTPHPDMTGTLIVE